MLIYMLPPTTSKEYLSMSPLHLTCNCLLRTSSWCSVLYIRIQNVGMVFLRNRLGKTYLGSMDKFLQSSGVHFFSPASTSIPVFLCPASFIFACLLSSHRLIFFSSFFFFPLSPCTQMSLFLLSSLKISGSHQVAPLSWWRTNQPAKLPVPCWSALVVGALFSHGDEANCEIATMFGPPASVYHISSSTNVTHSPKAWGPALIT